MRYKTIIALSMTGLLLACGIVSGYVQEDRTATPAEQITGTVTSYSSTELKVAVQISGSASFAYTFHLNDQTQIKGTIAQDKVVLVTYRREGFQRHHNLKFIALIVQVIQ